MRLMTASVFFFCLASAFGQDQSIVISDPLKTITGVPAKADLAETDAPTLITKVFGDGQGNTSRYFIIHVVDLQNGISASPKQNWYVYFSGWDAERHKPYWWLVDPKVSDHYKTLRIFGSADIGLVYMYLVSGAKRQHGDTRRSPARPKRQPADADLRTCAGAGENLDTFDQQFRRVQQPSTDDIGANTIGTLSPDFTPLKGLRDGTNTADAALASLDNDVDASPLQFANQAALFDPPDDPLRTGTQVTLLGARSMKQKGTIGNCDLTRTYLVNDVPNIGSARYSGMIFYNITATNGDSSGAVIDSSNRLLGIHVGGLTQAGIGIFFPVKQFLGSNLNGEFSLSMQRFSPRFGLDRMGTLQRLLDSAYRLVQ